MVYRFLITVSKLKGPEEKLHALVSSIAANWSQLVYFVANLGLKNPPPNLKISSMENLVKEILSAPLNI